MLAIHKKVYITNIARTSPASSSSPTTMNSTTSPWRACSCRSTSLWQVLGAIDQDERLTPLGWWGLPEAMLRLWAPSGGGPG